MIRKYIIPAIIAVLAILSVALLYAILVAGGTL